MRVFEKGASGKIKRKKILAVRGNRNSAQKPFRPFLLRFMDTFQ
jgi:hypothetical protein